MKLTGFIISLSSLIILSAAGNNFGDPGIGPELHPTCNLGRPGAQSALRVKRFPELTPRAPVALQPLENPESDSDEDWVKFMENFRKKSSYDIPILPDKEQIDSWKIRYRGTDIPIGVMSDYQLFAGKKRNFYMRGLTGCTAVFIASSHGMLAGHLWEGTEEGNMNGGSSFTKRYLDNNNRPAMKERTAAEFKAVALDIWGQATPDDEKGERAWKSFIDLQNDDGNPFRDGNNVEVFILTRAKSQKNADRMYGTKIDALRETILEHIPGANINIQTYADHDSRVTKSIQGFIGVQYSPHDNNGADDCTPTARVRVFYENKKNAVVDKQWAANGDQINTKNRRDTCKHRGWPIKSGYVAFGDSFAAGMGTGVTSGDSCRIGASNIGDLINAYTNNTKIDYQRRMCSGDTTKGLNRQIEEWKTPGKADVATVTMGGNDLGFSDIVESCVVVPLTFPFRWASTWRDMCKKSKAKAVKMMEDTGPDGIGPKLQAAYKRMVQKSARKDFHVYVSGYPGGFFNDQDVQPTDCKNTVFNWWGPPAYCPHWYDACYGSENIYLTVDLRKELDNMVRQFNTVIEAAVKNANKDLKSEQVHYVDVAPRFNNHRWCEGNKNPEWHEPDENRLDTWYFLSGWRDFGPGEDAAATAVPVLLEAAALRNYTNYMIDQGSIKLPPADTCESQLGTDPDPYAKWLCMVSNGVAKEAKQGGLQANGLTKDGKMTWTNLVREANNEIKAKNVTGQHIGYFYPTRQVKTFHPRTRGMYAYRDSIIDAIKRIQGGGVAAKSSPISHTATKTTLRTSASPNPTDSPAQCKGTTSGSTTQWTLTIPSLQDKSTCKSEADEFVACVAKNKGVTAPCCDCQLSDYGSVCAPKANPDGIHAAFNTGSGCDSEVLTVCVNQSFRVNGDFKQCAV